MCDTPRRRSPSTCGSPDCPAPWWTGGAARDTRPRSAHPQVLPAGAVVLVAFQAVDGGRPVVVFDHAVAPDWRWHPDVMAGRLYRAGFTERWRAVNRPDAEHRFPECHLLTVKETAEVPSVPVDRGCSAGGC